jgi:hypothetical protein
MSLLSMLKGLTAANVDFVVVGGVAARAHGSPRITEDLDVCYDTDEANLDRLAHVLASWNAYPRGVEPGLPFIMDRRTLTTSPILTLTTDEGWLDLLDIVEGIGDFHAVVKASATVEGGDLEFLALDLPGLVKAKKAAGRPKDLDQLPELEALIALRRQAD